jgi:hypothetical protein
MADAVKPLPLADIVERKVAAFVATVCENMAKEMEAYAKETRPWTDRTGQARKLIKGIVLDGGEQSYDVYDVKTETVKDKDGNVKKNKDGNPVITGKLNKKGTAVIRDSEGSVGVALVHRVDYGAALEEANNGRYAVLKPALQRFKAEFERAANDYFGGRG